MALSHKITAMLTLIMSVMAMPALANEPEEVYWEDLVPPGFNELAATETPVMR